MLGNLPAVTQKHSDRGVHQIIKTYEHLLQLETCEEASLSYRKSYWPTRTCRGRLLMYKYGSRIIALWPQLSLRNTYSLCRQEQFQMFVCVTASERGDRQLYPIILLPSCFIFVYKVVRDCGLLKKENEINSLPDWLFKLLQSVCVCVCVCVCVSVDTGDGMIASPTLNNERWCDLNLTKVFPNGIFFKKTRCQQYVKGELPLKWCQTSYT